MRPMSMWDDTKLVLAGLIGAIVVLPIEKELTTWKGKLFFLFSGVACSYFTTPLAVYKWSIIPELAGSVGFLLGAFGASLLAAGIRAVKSVDLLALIKSRFGGGN